MYGRKILKTHIKQERQGITNGKGAIAYTAFKKSAQASLKWL